MFAIFGVSEKIAEQLIEKKLRNVNSKFTKAYKVLSQDEQKKHYNKEVKRLVNTIKPKQVSGISSCPTMAKQLLLKFKEDPSFKDLQIKAKVPKRGKSNRVIKSKTTNKAILKWVDFNEYEDHLNLINNQNIK